jgi:hypothetical protein
VCTAPSKAHILDFVLKATNKKSKENEQEKQRKQNKEQRKDKRGVS